jgi:hypothetical protein
VDYYGPHYPFTMLHNKKLDGFSSGECADHNPLLIIVTKNAHHATHRFELNFLAE